MKKINLFFLIFCSYAVYHAQAPKFLNYQGLARDASNNIVVTPIGLKFELLQGGPTGFLVYDETNTSTPSSAGIFTAAIGSGVASTGTFSAINWATGPYFIRVSIDPAGGTSFSTVSTSQLLSVPYALYAETSGNSSALPTGTLTGQTLYWDDPSNTWIVHDNILNDGKQVVIGDQTIVGDNKLKVVSYSTTDSSAIFAYHPNAVGNQSAVRGFASGSSVNSGTLNFNPIMGGHFVGYNSLSNGSAVGAVGQGVSPGGDAIGMIAVGTSSSIIGGRSVGLYASGTGPTYINNFAAIFDRGKVFINDTLIINTNGNVGDVLTRGLNGKSYWSAGSGAGPWGRTLIGSDQNVHLQNISDVVGIGLPSGVGANEKLHVHNVTGDAYINLSTSIGSNNVGLVFGESANISKAFLAFDNSTNSLTYRHFGKRVFFMNGSDQNFFFGKIPIGATSISAMNIFDSVLTATPKPILRVVNVNGSTVGPAAIYLGDNTNNGLTLNYIKLGATNVMRFSDAFAATHYHTFTQNGEYFPGSNGTAGLANISGGPTTTSDLNFNASTNGRIVFNNGHIKAVGTSPSFSVSSSGTFLSAFPFTATPVGSCNDTKGYLRAASTFSYSFGAYSSFSDEIKITVTFNKPYANLPTVVVSPANDVLGLSFHTTVLSGNTGFNLYIRNSSGASIPVNANYQLDFNYIVIE